ncbi:MAG: hypothetical protein VZQ51_07540 [Bacteroidales bacterium]|nr:hypothetical protein [Bacteroidales bacterium]
MEKQTLTEGLNIRQDKKLTAEEAINDWLTLLVSGIMYMFFAAIGLPFLVLGLIGRAIKTLFNTRKNDDEAA